MCGAKMDHKAIADVLLAALDAKQQIAPITDALPAFGLADAARVQVLVTAARTARGERIVGRKIGFTNRTIWAEYGVHAPISGPMYDTTVAMLDGPVPLAALIEPRIEPEIVLRLSAAPEAGMSESELMACVSHVAHGFELVQSVFPGWRFRAADTVAGFGLHGALLHGPFTEIVPGDRPTWQAALADLGVVLVQNGTVADEGRSTALLGGGPLAALSHLVGAITSDPLADPVRAGEIVTTGTLTRALPVSPGEVWETRLDGIALGGLRMQLA